MISKLVTLSTTPTKVASANNTSITDPATVLITEASADVYVGGADVDATDGTKIVAGGYFSWQMLPGDDVYVVASAGTPTIKVLTNRGADV